MSPYTILVSVALIIAIAFGGASVGRRLERSTWQAKEIAAAAEAQKALLGAIASNQRAQQFNEAKARKATADHEAALSDLDKKYAAGIAAASAAGGLRIARAVCGSSVATEAAPASASGSNGIASASVELPAKTTDDLYALTKLADELAERLRALQAWIVSNGLYGEEPKK